MRATILLAFMMFAAAAPRGQAQDQSHAGGGQFVFKVKGESDSATPAQTKASPPRTRKGDRASTGTLSAKSSAKPAQSKGIVISERDPELWDRVHKPEPEKPAGQSPGITGESAIAFMNAAAGMSPGYSFGRGVFVPGGAKPAQPDPPATSSFKLQKAQKAQGNLLKANGVNAKRIKEIDTQYAQTVKELNAVPKDAADYESRCAPIRERQKKLLAERSQLQGQRKEAQTKAKDDYTKACFTAESK